MVSTVKTTQTCLSGSVEKRFTLLTGEQINRTAITTVFICITINNTNGKRRNVQLHNGPFAKKGLFCFFVVFILPVENKIQSNNPHR